MVIRSAIFLISNTNYRKCPKPVHPEYAFLGRSNVGKSSLINLLTGIKNLARISSVPGKTQLINHYLINGEWYLVDLPGLGYARTSKNKKKSWLTMTTDYLLSRPNLLKIFFLVDARLEPQQIDINFINWMGEHALPFTLIFTKKDKISRTVLAQNLELFIAKLSETWEEMPPYIITSSLDKTGRDEILGEIEKTNSIFYTHG